MWKIQRCSARVLAAYAALASSSVDFRPEPITHCTTSRAAFCTLFNYFKFGYVTKPMVERATGVACCFSRCTVLLEPLFDKLSGCKLHQERTRHH
eukprot:6465269-Amphidinium_carterae.2